MRLSGKKVQNENRRRLELQAEYKLSTLPKPAPTHVAHFLVHFFAVTSRLQFQINCLILGLKRTTANFSFSF